MIKKLIMAALMLLPMAAAAQTDATPSILYGYCDTPRGAITFSSTTTAGMAIQIDQSTIDYFKGGKITAIGIANGQQAKGSLISTQDITLFTSSAVNFGGIASDNMETYPGTMDLSKPFEYKEYPLPEPIEINDDLAPFWVGCTAVCNPKTGSPLCFDGMMHTDSHTSVVGVVDDGDDEITWVNSANQYGYACVRVRIEKEGLPVNEASVLDCFFPPTVAPGEKYNIELNVRNEASNIITDITVTAKLNSGDEQSFDLTLPSPIEYNEYNAQAVVIPIDAPDTASVNNTVAIRVTKVNGVANTSTAAAAKASGTFMAINPSTAFSRNMVAEIATGTDCGWCPIGIVGVGKMLQEHNDGTFIPIAVHVGDVMSTASYQMLQQNFTGSTRPLLVVNRNTYLYGMPNPSYDELAARYPAVRALPAMAQLAIKDVEYDISNPKKPRFNITSEVEFAFPMATNDNFGIAYVLAEDNVGPYLQENYYSGSKTAGMEEWNKLPEQVSTYYDHVARYIYLYNGATNSVPAQVAPGEKYEHSASVLANLVSDANNCHIVAMLINRVTGQIENAVTVPYSRFTAIETVEADLTQGPAVYYDLQGHEVAQPQSGKIYIQRTGNQSRTIRK